MKYTRLILRTAFQPTVRLLDATAVVITLVAKAIWGNIVTDEVIASYVIYFVVVILALRVIPVFTDVNPSTRPASPPNHLWSPELGGWAGRRGGGRHESRSARLGISESALRLGNRGKPISQSVFSEPWYDNRHAVTNSIPASRIARARCSGGGASQTRMSISARSQTVNMAVRSNFEDSTSTMTLSA